MSLVKKLEAASTVFFLCDLQTRFRSAIFAFDDVVATANKMLKVANILGVPVVATVQNAKALGPLVPELDLESLGAQHIATIDKTLFSMYNPEVKAILDARLCKSVVLFGIESHICVLQSTLDLLEAGYDVHIIADGVSSCNKEEVPFALERMRQAGAQITTSESIAFQLQRDSSGPTFKEFSKVIKNEKDTTIRVLQNLFSPVTKPNL
ncbi:Isochorismatase-like protein [Cristinia sonorae]|uniref:Isochorismatase-like protein n=1 Tax=Cristinia sonorae TaxID=1940300 RepID=A0A8K0UVN8_9AGAR|nr:Isochorismatase-like protein [Cristinia sonorae]